MIGEDLLPLKLEDGWLTVNSTEVFVIDDDNMPARRTLQGVVNDFSKLPVVVAGNRLFGPHNCRATLAAAIALADRLAENAEAYHHDSVAKIKERRDFLRKMAAREEQAEEHARKAEQYAESA